MEWLIGGVLFLVLIGFLLAGADEKGSKAKNSSRVSHSSDQRTYATLTQDGRTYEVPRDKLDATLEPAKRFVKENRTFARGLEKAREVADDRLVVDTAREERAKAILPQAKELEEELGKLLQSLSFETIAGYDRLEKLYDAAAEIHSECDSFVYAMEFLRNEVIEIEAEKAREFPGVSKEALENALRESGLFHSRSVPRLVKEIQSILERGKVTPRKLRDLGPPVSVERKRELGVRANTVLGEVFAKACKGSIAGAADTASKIANELEREEEEAWERKLAEADASNWNRRE